MCQNHSLYKRAEQVIKDIKVIKNLNLYQIFDSLVSPVAKEKTLSG